ncbi:hypothetical protein U472_07360 [Orenia metallireducens]|uniref:Uncharacterized protein n=1 Tax=Orenia metallireducens TaxID=1413210 RepID=A0A1C0AAG9_9FIRM|nr:hypothetical protein U472_07360 [Orenia metallireducens]
MEIYRNILESDKCDPQLVGLVIGDIGDMGEKELEQEIYQAFDAGRVDKEIISREDARFTDYSYIL